MIYTITLNPSLDYVMMVNELKNGETNRSQAEKIYPGGKGFNVSRILNQMFNDLQLIKVEGRPTLACLMKKGSIMN